jgi:hypothetical protein
MKSLSYSQLEVGSLYTTLLGRIYPRTMFSQPKRENICGEIDPEDAFVVLDKLEFRKDGKFLVTKEYWTKILTTKGVMGWTMFVEAPDTNPQFVELKS